MGRIGLARGDFGVLLDAEVGQAGAPGVLGELEVHVLFGREFFGRGPAFVGPAVVVLALIVGLQAHAGWVCWVGGQGAGFFGELDVAPVFGEMHVHLALR